MGIINGELIRKDSIIKGEVLDNNGTKCGQTSNVNYEVLKFEVNNKLGASLDVVIDEEAKKSMLHLLSKQGQLLSEVELKYFETSRLNRVYLDLDRKILIFTFNDDTSITCDISSMLDTLVGLIDQERQERIEGDLWENGTGLNSIQVKGSQNFASGDYSSASGYGTQAEANYSHTEGFITKVSSDDEHDARYGHAEGYMTSVTGLASHSEGDTTYTQNIGEHAEGRGNKSHKDSNGFGSSGNTIHSIGIAQNNQDITTFKNAVEVMQNGDHYIFGIGGYNGVDIENASTVQVVINGLIQNLANEIARATAKETELNSKIENEIQRAADKDNELESKITTETTRATDKENVLDAKIDSTKATLEQKIEESKGEAKNYTYSKSEIDSKDASTLGNSKAYTDVETTARANADTEIYNYIESIRFIETEVDW